MALQSLRSRSQSHRHITGHFDCRRGCMHQLVRASQRQNHRSRARCFPAPRSGRPTLDSTLKYLFAFGRSSHHRRARRGNGGRTAEAIRACQYRGLGAEPLDGGAPWRSTCRTRLLRLRGPKCPDRSRLPSRLLSIGNEARLARIQNHQEISGA